MTSPTPAINARPERESYGYEVVHRLREVGLARSPNAPSTRPCPGWSARA